MTSNADLVQSIYVTHADESQSKTTEGLITSEMVGLRYVSDNIPGISRKHSKTGFRYVDSLGNPIINEETIQRIKALVIPPAWTDIWISPWKNGHIQATGRMLRIVNNIDIISCGVKCAMKQNMNV